ncbi:hypothetical protein NQ315_000004 [Exocentrus adspersus]|uniref:Conserved oligomeric Golgi complex subunit 6 n=1 Tax=Exocentrus adspersus TaxID=1586481 RepID=A0AAV8VFL8_9CUCU|nr:hypothetical protein NQ315_000004 [Exocentrus adspersus]
MIVKKENEYMLSKRFNKVLETELEADEDTLEALKQLSTFYSENTLPSRRDLRSKIEKRSLDININLLSSFSKVKDTFMSIYNDIVEMNRCVDEITCKLQNSKQRSKALLQQTSMLYSGRNKNTVYQKIVSPFLNKVQLSPDESLILYGNQRSSSLTHATFSVLDKIQQIHNYSRILMRCGLQTVALDTMEHMVLHQEEALENIYRWTQNHCRYVDNLELTELIANAMSKLQDRPPLFRYIIDEYCVGRRSILVSAFIDALTKGGPSGKPAPIEMKAHDIQIYVTDMFVWLYKAISVEQQNLLQMLKFCDNIDSDFILDTLIKVCDGICQPLKIRIEKVLGVPTQAVILYSVLNLLRYYKKCICKILPRGSLENTLVNLQNMGEQVFFTTLQQEINNMFIKIESPVRDLVPTPAIHNLLALLRDMLSTANMNDGREIDMKKITQYIIEPLLRCVNEQASHLPALDMSIYTVNCIYDIFTCLSMFEFMDEFLERLQAQADAQIDNLTAEQASFLVANLNIGPIYTILQDSQREPLSTIPGMEPSNLQKFFLKLEQFITSPELTLLPQFDLLLSSKYKRVVEKRSREVVLAIYTQLFEAVNNPQNQYENPSSLCHKTPDELKESILL